MRNSKCALFAHCCALFNLFHHGILDNMFWKKRRGGRNPRKDQTLVKFRHISELSSASLRNWNSGIMEWWNNGFKWILVFLSSTSFQYSNIPSFLSRDSSQANKAL